MKKYILFIEKNKLKKITINLRNLIYFLFLLIVYIYTTDYFINLYFDRLHVHVVPCPRVG